MKKKFAVVVIATAFSASLAFADDSKNTLSDTPLPATPAAPVMPATAPAKTSTPAALAAPKTSAPSATDTTNSAPSGNASATTHAHHSDDASDDSKHHHKKDAIGDHLNDGTTTSTNANGNATTPIVDNNGHIRYICGTPVIDKHHNLIGSSNCETTASYGTTIVGDSAPAIISDGVWTFPPGRAYQEANGQWQICDGDLIIDTKIGKTTCKSLDAQSNVNITIDSEQDEPQPAAISTTPAYSGALHSDKAGLRSDSDILGK